MFPSAVHVIIHSWDAFRQHGRLFSSNITGCVELMRNATLVVCGTKFSTASGIGNKCEVMLMIKCLFFVYSLCTFRVGFGKHPKWKRLAEVFGFSI